MLIEGILKKRQKGHNIAKPKTLTEPFSTVSASIWTLRLFNRGCDICKDFRLEIPVIYCRSMQSGRVEAL